MCLNYYYYKLTTILVTICLLLITNCLCNRVDRFEGDTCMGKSYEGVCKKTTECKVAREEIKMYRRHSYTRCNFDGFTEIVCCPNYDDDDDGSSSSSSSTTSTTTTTTTPKNQQTEFREPDIVRKCEQECDKFSKNIKAEVKFQILNGENATAGEFPHMVGLAYRDEVSGDTLFECGGSLVSENYILTAAHCIINVSRRRPFMARMGKLSLISDEDKLQAQDLEIQDIVIHPNFTRRTRLNDIALLKLIKPVIFNTFVNPACLYTRDDDPIGLIITGWGTTSLVTKSRSLTILQKANGLSPVPTINCNETFFERVQTEVRSLQICAIDPDGKKDSCQGDSGGPLQVQDRKRSNIYSIVGVTSVGIACGGSVPGLYTRVSKYLDWIESVVWPNN